LKEALNNGKKCINVICPFAENSIGPEATKPSDVLTAYNGKTVEIAAVEAKIVLLGFLVDLLSQCLLVQVGHVFALEHLHELGFVFDWQQNMTTSL
jgi:hypothetical protein